MANNRYGISDGRVIEVEIPQGWAICCTCGDMWLLTGPGHYCVRRLMMTLAGETSG